MTQVALDYIKAALRRCNSYQSGETIATPDATDVLETFNDLLDSWSTDEYQVFGSVENILQWNSGQSIYKIGNPINSDLSLPNITGSISGNVITTTYTGLSNLVAGTSTLNASTITDLNNILPAGTFVTSVGSGSITLSNSAISPSSSDTFYFTVPGDFGIQRPLKITNAYTRFNQLDFTMDVYTDQTQFTQILYKAQPGPWPTVAWYNNAHPYGVLNVYQTPGNSADLHLYTDTILQNLTLYSPIVMPQGYARALKWCLAKEICAEFGFPMTDAIKTNSKEALDMIKALNAKPAVVSNYDPQICNRGYDAGYVLHGGYGR